MDSAQLVKKRAQHRLSERTVSAQRRGERADLLGVAAPFAQRGAPYPAEFVARLAGARRGRRAWGGGGGRRGAAGARQLALCVSFFFLCVRAENYVRSLCIC